MAKLHSPKSGEAAETSEQGAALIQQLQQRFAGFWQRLITPLGAETTAGIAPEDDYIEEYLTTLKERAYLERTIANQYRGRYLLELIQNAVDNMHKQAKATQAKKSSKSKVDLYRCHLELTPTALYVANDGLEFDATDVRGVCTMGQSTKPAGEYIGYKGLGFRAVLEITDTPEIYSGAYQFGFSHAETLALLATPETSSRLAKVEVPLLAVPHLRLALESEERDLIARLKKAGYATIIRLPLKGVAHIYDEVREACQQLLTSHTLLFLPYITELSIGIVDKTGVRSLATISKNVHELSIRPTSLSEEVRVSRLSFQRSEANASEAAGSSKAKANSKTEETSEKEKVTNQEDWLLVEKRQPCPIDSPELVASLEDSTWRTLTQVNLAVAFPLARMPWGGGDVFLKRRVDPLPFFAHFPTQEGSGLGFAVHADFYLSASRKQIEWAVPYNQWLTQRLVTFSCGPVLEAVHYLYPDEAALVEILLDYSYYNDNFGRAFREALDNKLASCAFVPVGNGLYMSPNRVVWTPLEQEGVLIFRRVFRYPGQDLYYPVLQLEEVYSSTKTSTEPTSDSSGTYESTYSSRSYDTDHSEYGYEVDPYGDSDRTKSTTEGAPNDQLEFDYKRIQRFLSSLGVKKLSPAQLPPIFGQALHGWKTGLIQTGEICAALALWYAELAKGDQEAGLARRKLVEQAQNLPVLPTISEGWQAPENREFIFAEIPKPSTSYFSSENTLIYDQASPLEADNQSQPLVFIRPDAYELAQFASLVREWHVALGVRPAK
ncbi:MAG: hypothetical protein HXX20_04935 [Chloroflexi bacterium]|nr:hypothetical protein [Chloroflexota bacterium]